MNKFVFLVRISSYPDDAFMRIVGDPDPVIPIIGSQNVDSAGEMRQAGVHLTWYIVHVNDETKDLQLKDDFIAIPIYGVEENGWYKGVVVSSRFERTKADAGQDPSKWYLSDFAEMEFGQAAYGWGLLPVEVMSATLVSVDGVARIKFNPGVVPGSVYSNHWVDGFDLFEYVLGEGFHRSIIPSFTALGDSPVVAKCYDFPDGMSIGFTVAIDHIGESVHPTTEAGYLKGDDEPQGPVPRATGHLRGNLVSMRLAHAVRLASDMKESAAQQFVRSAGPAIAVNAIAWGLRSGKSNT